jgi:hypothetical protein
MVVLKMPPPPFEPADLDVLELAVLVQQRLLHLRPRRSSFRDLSR